MGFTLVAYSESIDTGALLEAHAAISDQHVTVSGDNVRVPDFAPNVIGLYEVGANSTRAQLTSPSLRKRNPIDISPVDNAAEPVNLGAFHDYTAAPISLTPAEDLQFHIADDDAGAAVHVGLVWLADKIDAMPKGELRTIRATASATLVANAWTIGSLTLSQQLEAGRYAVVGMRAESAGLKAARLVIPGSEKRPGCIGYDGVGDLDHKIFRRGGLGNWGEFEHTFPPQVEFLSLSADTSEVVYLDLIHLG